MPLNDSSASSCAFDSSSPVDGPIELSAIKEHIELLSYNVVESACRDLPPPERLARPKCPHYATLAKVMDELNANNTRVFSGMVKRLGADKLGRDEAAECLTRVFKEMHADKHYNWGRLAAMYTFLRCLAKYLVDCGKIDYLDGVASATSSFVCENLSTWIYQEGGWESFEKFFGDKTTTAMDSPLWQGLLYTIVGLGALGANLRIFKLL